MILSNQADISLHGYSENKGGIEFEKVHEVSSIGVIGYHCNSINTPR